MKKFLVAITTFVLAAVLVACSGSDKFQVDVFIYNYADTYIGGVRGELATLLAKNKDIDASFHNADNKQDEQNTQIDAAIAAGSDLLVVNIVEPLSAEIVLSKAKAAKIPVLFFNREVSDAVINSYGKDTAFIGTDPDEAGYMQGELAADILLANYKSGKFAADKVVNYAMIRAELTNPEANGRTEFSVKEANRLLKADGKPEMKRLGADLVANWDTALAKTAMAGLLESEGVEKFDIIFANNDDMALGIISALQDLGYNKGDASKYIPVLGVDATATAGDAINTGSMAGSIKQDGTAMAIAIDKFIANKAANKDFNEGTDYVYETGVAKLRIPYAKFTVSGK